MVAIFFCRRSSWTRDRTCISCIGRWILYHRTIWEAQAIYYLLKSHLLLFFADGTLTLGWVCQPSSLVNHSGPISLAYIYVCVCVWPVLSIDTWGDCSRPSVKGFCHFQEVCESPLICLTWSGLHGLSELAIANKWPWVRQADQEDGRTRMNHCVFDNVIELVNLPPVLNCLGTLFH